MWKSFLASLALFATGALAWVGLAAPAPLAWAFGLGALALVAVAVWAVGPEFGVGRLFRAHPALWLVLGLLVVSAGCFWRGLVVAGRL
jgi:hypothetical protein